MFLYPSKPKVINDPNKLIEMLRQLGKLENYQVQVKKNGSRAVVWIDANGKVTIYDRRNSMLTMAMEMDWSSLGMLFPFNSLLDGELIGRKQGEISNRLYLWDMPIISGEDLTKISYGERFNELRQIFLTHSDPILTTTDEIEQIKKDLRSIQVGVAKSYPAENWQELLNKITYGGSTGENEGLVFKDTTHNLSWSRWKTSEIDQQVKCLIKYMTKNAA